MPELYDQIQEATSFIQSKWKGKPTVGIVLGTGLGGLAGDIKTDLAIHYGDIPHFPHSTAPSHKGQLVCGQLGGKTVVAMEGRFHFYEGYSLQKITFPIRVMKALGCTHLIVSNACGGLNPQWSKGDIMLIDDQINLLGDNPLIGPNDERLGERFPDMSRPYCPDLIALMQRVSVEEKIPVQKGVFVAVPGPCLETRAEYRFLRGIGADVVGMSTVPEAIVGVHAKLKILGLSVITDQCLPDALEPAKLEDIIAVANTAEKKLRTLVKRFLAELK